MSMENVMNVAAYIANRYFSEHGQRIDEMKLHKLMYFAQRESFIQTGKPLFNAVFYGWKYGPVLKEVRSAYRDGSITDLIQDKFEEDCSAIFDRVFKDYAGKDSWSLSRLTHGELSWKNSRIGISEEANSDKPMSTDDIKKDAERIKSRREMLGSLGLI